MGHGACRTFFPGDCRGFLQTSVLVCAQHKRKRSKQRRKAVHGSCSRGGKSHRGVEKALRSVLALVEQVVAQDAAGRVEQLFRLRDLAETNGHGTSMATHKQQEREGPQVSHIGQIMTYRT